VRQLHVLSSLSSIARDNNATVSTLWWTISSSLQGSMKAGAKFSSVIGQFCFGKYLFTSRYTSLIIHTLRLCCGCFRTFVHLISFQLFTLDAILKQLMLIILATILLTTSPASSISPGRSPIYPVTFIRVGGDYPMSATITESGKPSQAWHHLGLYVCESRLVFFHQFPGNNQCTGLLQR